MMQQERSFKTKALAPAAATIVSLLPMMESRGAIVITVDTQSNPAFSSAAGNDGIKFSPNFDIVVDALGYFDHLRDGFQFSHGVGIFDAVSQALLASVTITSNDTLIGDFRFESITPLALSAGRSYMLVGQARSSAVDKVQLFRTIDSAVTFEGNFINLDSTLTYPTTSGRFGHWA